MSATPTYYFDTIVAPHLSDSPAKDDFLTAAAQITSATYYGALYSWAVALQAAHLMYMAGLDTGSGRQPGNPGVIAAVKEDELAISYANGVAGSGNIDDLQQSSYGKQLLSLQRRANIPMSVTGTNDALR